MLTGYQLAYNGQENVACYAAGLASASGLELTPIPCAGDGGKLLGIEWAIPCSNNGGASLTGFSYQMAPTTTKPRADAVKVITVQDSKTGTYGRWVVPDSYTTSDFVEACCAGCEPLPAVTLVEPILLTGECVLAAPTIPPCVYYGEFYVQALTGTNDTYTLTAIGYDANGAAVTFSPTTVAAATPTLLAAAAQTAWASEMGTGTFTATGNTIAWTATTVKSLGTSIVQSDV